MTDKFKQLVNEAERILVTAHISPDPDAVSSLLVLGTTLRSNFPDKNILLALEEEPVGLDFLSGYEHIKFGTVLDQIKAFEPQLFVLLDGSNFERCSRKDGEQLRAYLLNEDVRTAIIDHHELDGKDEADVFINTSSPATAQDVYRLCKELGYKLPAQAAQTAMTGFYADTNGFLYAKEGKQADLFDFAKELVIDGANVESAQNSLDNYSAADLEVLDELFKNMTHDADYNYTFLSDDFIESWIKTGRSQPELQRATHTLLNDFIRNIEHRTWGFLAYRSFSDGPGVYTVSLRSREGHPDVSAIAMVLGGGGHKPAAGARFQATNLEDALQKIRSSIVE